MPPKLKSAPSAPFSTHTRGVPLFDRSRFFNVPAHLARCLLDLRDISSSLFWFISCQTWLTLWSSLITMLSVIFFSLYESGKLYSELDWSHILFATMLPLIVFTWSAYNRRERCLDELSRVKLLLIGINTAIRDWKSETPHPHDLLADVQGSISEILETMHTYFLPTRFYSRSYPMVGFRSSMVAIAVERAKHRTVMRAAASNLSSAVCSAGLAPALEAQLHAWIMDMMISIDKMANVKEFRTPQGIRSLARFYIVLFIPLFYGPYWSWVAETTNFAFAFFFSILTQIALVGVLNTAVALEDPFDNVGMDGIFVDEPLYEVELEMLNSKNKGSAALPPMTSEPTTALSPV